MTLTAQRDFDCDGTSAFVVLSCLADTEGPDCVMVYPAPGTTSN